MLFKRWLLINENIESNFDKWMTSIVKYAKPEDLSMMKYVGFFGSPRPNDNTNLEEIILELFNNGHLKTFKDIIVKVLSRKKLENINWLSFSLGYLAQKVFHEEDLELAIDVTKRRISSRDLPKSEIGEKGWIKIGVEAKSFVDQHIRNQQEISNRQKNKLKKHGETLEEDSELIKTIAKEDNLTLYFFPSLEIHPDSVEDAYKKLSGRNQVEARKRLFCKYGKGTSWCTANPTGNYDRYYINNNIFILHSNNSPKYQFISCKDDGTRAGASSKQFMDVNDEYVENIDFNEFKFLNKHVKNEISCYSFKINFKDIEEYKNSKQNIKISLDSAHQIITNTEFKKLKPEERQKVIRSIDMPSSVLEKYLLEEKEDSDFLSNEQIESLIWFSRRNLPSSMSKLISNHIYLLNQLSSKRFEEFIGEKPRKGFIRSLLLGDSNTPYSEKGINSFLVPMIKLLRNKININSGEAYTIFDICMGQILTWQSDAFETFADAMGQELINKIDLERLKNRMHIVFSNGKFEVSNGSNLSNLMVSFLNKHYKK